MSNRLTGGTHEDIEKGIKYAVKPALVRLLEWQIDQELERSEKKAWQ